MQLRATGREECYEKIFLILIMCVLASPITVHGEKQELSQVDGNDWTGWEAFRKYSFISGYIAGTAYVVEHNIQSQDEKFDSEKASQLYWSYIIPDEKKPKNTFSRKEVTLLLRENEGGQT
jgi:hypothetical protein